MNQDDDSHAAKAPQSAADGVDLPMVTMDCADTFLKARTAVVPKMAQKLLVAFIAGLVAHAATAAPCRAQWSFSFGYSEGYRGHHHHYHHPHWHGPYWYRPYVDYVYVAPPPLYVAPMVTPIVPAQPAISATSPTLAPPAQTNASSASTTAPTVVKSNSLPAYSGTGVTIRNPAASGGDVSFLVDERLQMQLAPGEAAPLKEKGSYTVTFDRGGDFGTTHRVLGEGAYEFVATEKGWELRREPADGEQAVPNLPTVRRNPLPPEVTR